MKIKQGHLTDEKKVREFAASLSRMDNFKASKGWFVKFCERCQIRLPVESGGQNVIGEIESTDSLLT